MDKSNITTDRIAQKTPRPVSTHNVCGYSEMPCPYDEAQMKRWVEQKISASTKSEMSFWLKAGMFTVPFIVSFFIWISNLDKRVSLIEVKQSEITELKEQVREMKEELVSLRIQIERILSRIERSN